MLNVSAQRLHTLAVLALHGIDDSTIRTSAVLGVSPGLVSFLKKIIPFPISPVVGQGSPFMYHMEVLVYLAIFSISYCHVEGNIMCT